MGAAAPCVRWIFPFVSSHPLCTPWSLSHPGASDHQLRPFVASVINSAPPVLWTWVLTMCVAVPPHWQWCPLKTTPPSRVFVLLLLSVLWVPETSSSSHPTSSVLAVSLCRGFHTLGTSASTYMVVNNSPARSIADSLTVLSHTRVVTCDVWPPPFFKPSLQWSNTSF